MSAEHNFETYELAAKWAKESPSHMISRSRSGEGFIGTIKAPHKDTAKADHSELESTRVAELVSRISREFFASVGYSRVGRLDSIKVLRFLAPLDIKQLLILRAAVELEYMSAKETSDAGLSDGRQAADTNSILRLIGENMETKRVHEYLKNYRHSKRRRHSASTTGEMGEVYEAASSGDGGDAYLSDGMWITPDGKVYDADR